MHRVLRGNDDSGFTLVEVLVAMVIISGVLLSLIFVQTASLRTAVQAKQRVQATATDELADLPVHHVQSARHGRTIGEPSGPRPAAATICG